MSGCFRHGVIYCMLLAPMACDPAGGGGGHAMPDPSPATRALERSTSQPAHRQAVFAAGCFWCVEAMFEPLQGVIEVQSGYTGGRMANPSYEQVCSGKTGHAEAVRVTYDPQQIGYADLLQVFFATHDPTQLNRQGPDVGSQYRSAIFYADPAQRQAAESYMAQLVELGTFDRRLATSLEPLGPFYPAEAYHQDFAARQPDHPYIKAYVPAKLKKLKKTAADKLK